MTVYADIRRALEVQLATIVAGGAPEIAWENERFEPTVGAAWLRPVFAPQSSRPTDVTASGLKRYDGTFLVDVFAPQGNGPAAADVLAASVIAAFAPGTPLTKGSVTVQVEWSEVFSAATLDPPWYTVPTTVKWKSFN